MNRQVDALLTKQNKRWIITRNDGKVVRATTEKLLKALITSRNHSLTGSFAVVINKNVFVISVDNFVSLIDNKMIKTVEAAIVDDQPVEQCEDALTCRNVRTPATYYLLRQTNKGDTPKTIVFEAQQISTESGTVLSHDSFSYVDIVSTMHYNCNCRVITLYRGTNAYDFDKEQLTEFINNVAKY